MGEIQESMGRAQFRYGPVIVSAWEKKSPPAVKTASLKINDGDEEGGIDEEVGPGGRDVVSHEPQGRGRRENTTEAAARSPGGEIKPRRKVSVGSRLGSSAPRGDGDGVAMGRCVSNDSEDADGAEFKDVQRKLTFSFVMSPANRNTGSSTEDRPLDPELDLVFGEEEDAAVSAQPRLALADSPDREGLAGTSSNVDQPSFNQQSPSAASGSAGAFSGRSRKKADGETDVGHDHIDWQSDRDEAMAGPPNADPQPSEADDELPTDPDDELRGGGAGGYGMYSQTSGRRGRGGAKQGGKAATSSSTSKSDDEKMKMEVLGTVFSLRRPRDFVAGTSSGVKTVLRGVALGVGSLFGSPVVGCREAGVVGFTRGVGVGLVGFAAATTAGVLVGGFQIARGIANTVPAIVERGRGRHWNRDDRGWEQFSLLSERKRVDRAAEKMRVHEKIGLHGSKSDSARFRSDSKNTTDGGSSVASWDTDSKLSVGSTSMGMGKARMGSAPARMNLFGSAASENGGGMTFAASSPVPPAPGVGPTTANTNKRPAAAASATSGSAYEKFGPGFSSASGGGAGASTRPPFPSAGATSTSSVPFRSDRSFGFPFPHSDSPADSASSSRSNSEKNFGQSRSFVGQERSSSKHGAAAGAAPSNTSSSAPPPLNSAARHPSKEPDLYDVLELTPQTANASSIRKAYYKKSLLYHPDKNRSSGSSSSNISTTTTASHNVDKFHLITKAYQILADPEKRRIYDGNRERAELLSNWSRSSSQGGGSSSYQQNRSMWEDFDLPKIDPSVFFAVLFGSQYFEPYVGKLHLAQYAEAEQEVQEIYEEKYMEKNPAAWPALRLRILEKRMQFYQRKRELDCCLKLVELFAPYVGGGSAHMGGGGIGAGAKLDLETTAEFEARMQKEALRLRTAANGREMLKAIGWVYCMQADIQQSKGHVWSRIRDGVQQVKARARAATVVARSRVTRSVAAAAQEQQSRINSAGATTSSKADDGTGTSRSVASAADMVGPLKLGQLVRVHNAAMPYHLSVGKVQSTPEGVGLSSFASFGHHLYEVDMTSFVVKEKRANLRPFAPPSAGGAGEEQEDRDIDETVYDEKGYFLDALWQVTLVDIQNTSRSICRKLCRDQHISQAERRKRIDALRRLGTIFLNTAATAADAAETNLPSTTTNGGGGAATAGASCAGPLLSASASGETTTTRSNKAEKTTTSAKSSASGGTLGGSAAASGGTLGESRSAGSSSLGANSSGEKLKKTSGQEKKRQMNAAFIAMMSQSTEKNKL
eukprot:g6845.t1